MKVAHIGPGHGAGDGEAPTAAMVADENRPRLLCVDDEEHVLDAMRDTLRRSFDVWTADSGARGIEILGRYAATFAVVISDMRMPKMSGAAFLRAAELIAPDATKMLLTGDRDLQEASRAVNSAQLFRFLTKPCEAEELKRACAAALGHHRIRASERRLLVETVRGSVSALAEALAISNPAAFGRSSRIKRWAVDLARAAGMANWWEVEVAATLSDLGAVALPVATAEKLYSGEVLSAPEEAMVQRVPETTRSLLGKIPRLEGVLEILDGYHAPDIESETTGPISPSRLGAQVLRLAADYDALVQAGTSGRVALGALRSRGQHDPILIDTFAQVVGVPVADVREVGSRDLRVGMTFADDVRTAHGGLLVARGQPVTEHLVERLDNFAPGVISEPLRVFVV